MSILLSEIQNNLEDIYEVSISHNILDFLITDKKLAGVLSNTPITNDVLEQLLLATDEEYLNISLYLDSDLVSRLGKDYLSEHTDKKYLHDFWVALEGVSHFLYLAWNASHDRPVSQLELELQAEVDKFVSATTAISSARDTTDMQKIWSMLFSTPKFRANIEHEHLLRYQKANAYASQYCKNLVCMRKKSNIAMQNELRKFYRLNQQQKISHIEHSSTTHRA